MCLERFGQDLKRPDARRMQMLKRYQPRRDVAVKTSVVGN